MKPTIAITAGDPAGIGPEVILKALEARPPSADERLIVLGDRRAFHPAATGVNFAPKWHVIGSVDGLDSTSADIVLVDFANAPAAIARTPSREGGQASLDYLHAAIDLARTGRAHAIATAPIHKAAIALAGCRHPGHTEILAERTGTADFVMMLAGPQLRVALVTIHVPLRRVFELITFDSVRRTIVLAGRSLREMFGIPEPRIAVAGLNPHAGEQGRFGTEETEIIGPAIEAARAEGIDCTGPCPPDTVFHNALAGMFDAVVVMYHDQGLIAIKSTCFDTAVNITLGLPIIRTSADHGTAYDIAGRGIANHQSMARAITLAAQFARRKALRTG